LSSALPEVPQGFRRAVGCNVAGSEVASEIEAALSRRGISILWNLATARQAGVVNAYDTPAQLGADRWAALIGAWARVGRACVVVNAGTAITIDSLDDSGVFRGGVILPGLMTMLQSLEARTAALRHVPGRFSAFPANTADAMTTGVIDAAVGAVGRVHERLARVCGGSLITVLAGGGAEDLAPHLGYAVLRVEALVLEGLRVVAREVGP
jgi:type III pantothenate kinase